jgi:molybdopterin-guanine dinucleotide biosynthesis protein MobB
MLKDMTTPFLGFVAWNGTGKTTLLRHLLPILKSRGMRVGMIKHSHHRFEIDYPGKDSYELRKAGASQMLIASSTRVALIRDTLKHEASLEQLLGQMNLDELDLVLIEGFKQEAYPKIECHRPSLGKPLMHPELSGVLAVASDAPCETPLPQFNLNSPLQIAQWIRSFVQAWKAKGAALDDREITQLLQAHTEKSPPANSGNRTAWR